MALRGKLEKGLWRGTHHFYQVLLKGEKKIKAERRLYVILLKEPFSKLQIKRKIVEESKEQRF